MSTVENTFLSLTGRAQQDARAVSNLGNELDQAQQGMDAAVSGGNSADIQVAQIALEKATQKLQLKSSTMAAVNKLIEQIIARLAQIGG